MDIIKQLRNHALPDPYDEREVMHAPLLRAAADEIEKLRKERDDLHMDYRMKCDVESKELLTKLTRYREVMKRAVEAFAALPDLCRSDEADEALTALRECLKEEGK